MTQKMIAYIGIGWLFLVVGPLAVFATFHLNKTIRKIHPEKGFLFRLFPVSPALRSELKIDKTYQRIIWANVSSVIFFFLLMFVAKSME